MTIFIAPEIPDINFGATTVYELADLGCADTEAPVTQHLNDQELQNLLLQPLELDLPVSTIAVELAVKTTTAAAQVSADRVEQDGFSMMAIAARTRNPRSTCDVPKEWNV